MTMRLYDTASHRLVDWQPPQEVRMYVCGITPYDSAHLGHILTFMTYDLLQRYLEEQGHQVTMVRNITDVDDPIFRRAEELGVPYQQLATDETKSFHKVLGALGFRRPAHEPKASEYIEEMAAAVSTLLDKQMAYFVGRDIYFDTARDPAFGSFSGFSERLQCGLLKSRGGDPDRPGKHSPFDSLLWRAAIDPADPAVWQPSARHIPAGRPGWHIECSAMSAKLLGTPFDIHGGGNDLIYPHHEAEIAQTRALGSELATQWIHVAALSYHGEKMSKSLGNLTFAKDLLPDHEASAIRLALMHYSYRIGGEWLPCLLYESAELLRRVRHAASSGAIDAAGADRFARAVRAALANNLDTHAIVHLLEGMATTTALPGASLPATAEAQLSHTFELLGLVLFPGE